MSEGAYDEETDSIDVRDLIKTLMLCEYYSISPRELDELDTWTIDGMTKYMVLRKQQGASNSHDIEKDFRRR